jgi:hypothetical protein
VLDRILCGAFPSALKWTEGTSRTHYNYRAPMVWSFDTLRRLTVMRFLSIKGHRIRCPTFSKFLKMNHIMEILFANLFSFSIVLPSIRESSMFKKWSVSYSHVECFEGSIVSNSWVTVECVNWFYHSSVSTLQLVYTLCSPCGCGRCCRYVGGICCLLDVNKAAAGFLCT